MIHHESDADISYILLHILPGHNEDEWSDKQNSDGEVYNPLRIWVDNINNDFSSFYVSIYHEFLPP